MKPYHLLVALTVGVVGLSMSPSRFSPPPRFPLDVAPTPTLKSAPSSSLTLGSLVVVLAETTLDEAVRNVGVGSIAHQGDAGESTYWVCYSVAESRQKEGLWLLSSGEMGGPNHVIDAVVSALDPNTSTDTCPELPKKFQPVTLNSGIWLGTTSARIRSKFGKPSLERDSWIHYHSRRGLPGDPRAKDFGTHMLYEYAGLSLRIDNGKAVELWATKSVADE